MFIFIKVRNTSIKKRFFSRRVNFLDNFKKDFSIFNNFSIIKQQFSEISGFLQSFDFDLFQFVSKVKVSLNKNNAFHLLFIKFFIFYSRLSGTHYFSILLFKAIIMVSLNISFLKIFSGALIEI